MKSGGSSFSWNIRSVGASPTSGTPWQQMLQNWFRHVVLSHWLVPYFILNWLSNKLLVDVWPFLVEMMAVTTDGSLLWQTPAYDGEDATCIQRSLSLHSLLAISIMWLMSVTHALDDQFGGQGYDNACFCFIPGCDGALRGRARAICPCMKIVIALESARIRSGNFDWLSSHLQWTGRSQEANWVDFAQAWSGASGTAIEDKRTAWVSEGPATLEPWGGNRQPFPQLDYFPCELPGGNNLPGALFQFVCGLRWPCRPLKFSSICKEVGSRQPLTTAFLQLCFAVSNPAHHEQVYSVGHTGLRSDIGIFGIDENVWLWNEPTRKWSVSGEESGASSKLRKTAKEWVRPLASETFG